MIPIRLTIQGLYSYQARQTIDFTKLTSAHLFGIFGAVGSGKSSILEAITFAIYGETDRLNARDGRNYNMMNLKSSELLIEFDFETGKEQTPYRAVVKGRRNSKKFDDVKALDRSAYRFDSGEWIPIEVGSLPEIIGLSYENFKRTIIIPQGQFQEFLQLGNKERTVMMKSLFNLERFELDAKAASLEAKNNGQKQNLEGQLQQLGVVDPEQQNALEEKLDNLKKEMEALNLKLVDQQKIEAEQKQLHDLILKKEMTQGRLTEFAGKLPEIELLEKKIERYEYCLIHFKNLLEGQRTATQKIQSLDKKIAEDGLKLKQAEEQIGLVEKQFETVKAEYDRRELLRQKAEELEKLIRLADIQQLIVAAEERLKKGGAVVETTMQTIDKLKQEREKLEVDLAVKKAVQPDLLTLANVRSWYELQAGFTQQLKSISIEAEKYKDERKLFGLNEQRLFESPLLASFSGEKNTTNGLAFLKEKVASLKNQISELDSAIQHFRVQLKLEEFAVGLTDGEACPVCGSVHHPLVLVTADVAQNLKLAEAKKEAFEKEISACEKLAEQFGEVANLLIVNGKQMTGILERKKDLEAKETAHKQLFQWKKYPTAESVAEAFRQAETLKKEVDLLEKQKDETSKKLDSESANKEKYQQQIEKIRNEVTAFKAEVEILQSQIKLVNSAQYAEKSKSEIESEKNDLLLKYRALEEQFNALNNQLVELRKMKDSLAGSILANQIQLFQEKKLLDELGLQLEAALKSSAFASLNEVGNILEQPIDILSERSKINAFRQEMVSAQTQIQQLQNEIGDRKYDAEIHRQLQEQLAENRQLLNQLNRDFGVTEKTLADLKKALAAQAELRKTLEKLELRAENIRTLRGLFKASGFVNYVSSVYLQNLCNAANDRFFRLTRQKLSLEITEDNNFQVRDYMNGGMVRSVKTLSGGQTFQAALCLALALADNIQKINESNQNFFFLDEGFGSLDKESLSTVFDALKSLRKENRIVGVISHVEEMQQEIDTHLRIENHEETGSRILTSW
jgi:ATPase involved in DNA repair